MATPTTGVNTVPSLCTDCAKPKKICPTDVLKGLQTLEAIENYLFGNANQTVPFQDAKKGINEEIPCVGFHLTYDFATKDDGNWRVVEVNEKVAGFGRTTIMLKSIMNEVNRVMGQKALILYGTNGAVDPVILNPEVQLNEEKFDRLKKLVQFLNY